MFTYFSKVNLKKDKYKIEKYLVVQPVLSFKFQMTKPTINMSLWYRFLAWTLGAAGFPGVSLPAGGGVLPLLKKLLIM